MHLDPLNTTTPILVLAVAAGHAIQILKRYYEEYGRLRATMPPRDANREAVIESMVRVGPVMIVAGLIATITFLSLAGTGIPMVQHFGVFAGCGVLATMIIEMTVIPAVRSMLRPPREREAARERKAGVLDRFLTGVADNLVGGRAPVFVAGGLMVLALVGFGVTRLRIDNNFRLYFRPESAVRVDDRVLNDTFGGTNSIQFLVQTPEADGIKDPRVLQGHGAAAGLPRDAAGRRQDAVDGGPDQADESGHARRRPRPTTRCPTARNWWRSTCFSTRCPATRRTSTAWWTTTIGAPRCGRSSRTTARPTPTRSPGGRAPSSTRAFRPA